MNDLLVKLTTRLPASAAALADAEKALGMVFPEDYKLLMTASNGFTGVFGARYLALFSLEELLEVNRAAQVAEWAAGFVLFASDLGGISYLFDTRANGSGFLEVHDDDMGFEEPKHCANSLVGFLRYVYLTGY